MHSSLRCAAVVAVFITVLSGAAGAMGAPRDGDPTAGTSPDASGQPEGLAAPVGAITFSELPVGTRVRDQYVGRGIRFSGDQPFITTDSSTPTSPVLTGTPQFAGMVIGRFVRPGTHTAETLDHFSVDVGYINNPGSVRMFVYGSTDRLLGVVTANQRGQVRLLSRFDGAASFAITAVSREEAGFAVDNVTLYDTIYRGRMLHDRNSPRVVYVTQDLHRREVPNPVIRDCLKVRANAGDPVDVSASVIGLFEPAGRAAWCPYPNHFLLREDNGDPQVWIVKRGGRIQRVPEPTTRDCLLDRYGQATEGVVPAGEIGGHIVVPGFAACP